MNKLFFIVVLSLFLVSSQAGFAKWDWSFISKCSGMECSHVPFTFGPTIAYMLGTLFTENVYENFAKWYEVEDWEKKVCTDWGGTTPGKTANPSSKTPIVDQESITVNAIRRYDSFMNLTSYEIAWFVQPFDKDYEGISIRMCKTATCSAAADYEVVNIGSDKEKATPIDPSTGYYYREIVGNDNTYIEVNLIWKPVGEDSLNILVPFANE